jgi:probable HAF family extracellular repeat protein
MTGLGALPGGNFSGALAVNADGTVVVGDSASTSHPSGEAFRWVYTGSGPNGGGVMTGLGVLAGYTSSRATAVSADGAIVVGNSQSMGGQQAFRWSAASGMRSVQDLLVASGVNMTGWSLQNARGISADGHVIVGDGTDPSNNTQAWIARFPPPAGLGGDTGTGSGLITVGGVAQSFAGQSALGQTGNAAIGGTLGTLNEYATQAHASQGARNTPYSVFAYAGYDSDPAGSGTLGLTRDLPHDIVVGATLGASYVKTDMVFDGRARMSGGGASAFVARMPNAGLQWLVGIAGIALTGDVTRGYLNGSGLASSSGSTNADGYGATARIGWVFDPTPVAQLTPFASYTVSTIHFDGYTEINGVFPAQFDGFNATAQTARLGADARYSFAPGKWVWGTLASAHRLDGGKSPDITGTLIGLFSMTAPGISSATDWAELTAGIRLPVWSNGAITASVTTSLVPHQATTYVSRLGVTQAF